MRKFCFLLLLVPLLVFGQIEGAYTGVLKVQGAELRIVMHFSPEGVALDSPDQGAYGIEGTINYMSADSVSVAVPKMMMKYGGRRTDEGNIEGVFSQGFMKLPLTLKPGEQKLVRPQTPVAPFPYTEEEVLIEAPDAILAGTLAIPEDAKAAVVLVSGSGLQNRDEELFEHKPFAVIADFLARKGIASLRYDDRGAGSSKGDASEATTADFASDAAAVLDFLRGRFDKTGIIGHSEGGMIAYMLAAGDDAPDFVVSIAGPAVRGDSILVYQNEQALLRSGVDSTLAANFADALQKAFQMQIDGHEGELTDEELDAIFPGWEKDSMAKRLAGRLRGIFEDDEPNVWIEYFKRNSPAPYLRAMHVPALIIYGEKDRQVPPSLNLDAARRNAPGAEIVVFEELNHLMQPADTGSPDEYGKIETTISPAVLERIVAFILASVN